MNSLKKSVDHDVMKNKNKLLALNCILENGPVSRKEVKEKTGLSWSTVSVIVNDLTEKKIIVEKKMNDGHVGRAPLVLDAYSDRNFIIGLDINISGITATLIDLRCRVVCSSRIQQIEKEKDVVIERIFKLIDSIFEKYSTNSKNILGIGISMQGAVDSLNGISIYNPYFNNWANVPLKAIFEDKYKIPAFINRSPNCMALCERWLGIARGVRNMLFIRQTLGVGIGMSLTINGEIFDGENSNAGEFGHMTMKPDGRRCSCGNYGCLETVASYDSIVWRMIEGIKSGKRSILTQLSQGSPLEEMDISLIFKAYSLGDEFCIEVMNEMATYLGIAISNAINIFNPDLVILGGDLTKYESMYMDRVREVVEMRTWKYSIKSVLVSQITEFSAPIGAAIAIIQKICNGELNLNHSELHERFS